SWQLKVTDQTRGRFHARLRAGFASDRDEDVPKRDRAVLSRDEALHAVGSEERHLSGPARERLAHRFPQPAHAPLVLANRQHDQIRRIFFQKTKTGLHGIFAQPEHFGDLDAELLNRSLRTAFRDELPSLERVADAGEILPLGT